MVPLYIRAHQAASSALRAEKAETPDLAPLTERIELHDKFLQVTANLLMNRTVTGHTDLTRRALQEFIGEEQLSTHAQALIIAASQMPDLYRWEDERYHAHTCTHPSVVTRRCHPNRTPLIDRPWAIEDSQHVYLELMADVVALVQLSTEADKKSQMSRLTPLPLPHHAVGRVSLPAQLSRFFKGQEVFACWLPRMPLGIWLQGICN